MTFSIKKTLGQDEFAKLSKLNYPKRDLNELQFDNFHKQSAVFPFNHNILKVQAQPVIPYYFRSLSIGGQVTLRHGESITFLQVNPFVYKI